MHINTLRFGEVEIDESKILTFYDGIPGFEELKRFCILQFEESYPIVWLQAIDDENISLPVIDTFLVLPDYAFNIEDDDAEELALTHEDLQVITVLVIPDNIDGMTANLAAPLIINMRTGRGKQIVLRGGEYNVRYPIFPEVCRVIKEERSDAGAVKEG